MRKIDGGPRVARQASPSRKQPSSARLLIALVAIVFSGCALARASPKLPTVDISGVWEGTSTVTPCGFFHTESICNATNRITLALIQNGSAISGRYRCDFGNYICRHDNETRAGYISSGKITGDHVAMRVMIPADISSCIFHGKFTSRRASGMYTCYEGGGVVEMGIWATERVY